ncbi:MAG: hypothetical protein A2268_00645 [Candidatus Raymondbacteria bacterium RifOxyA12_full_50_37]|uniref:RHS repeat-associated core domain-containing protein n=1 Tax=Candidatus Raymondbacteria bacterium RIFOXYD12_FULL_49_13 TaxID=1817890 RepID=A0A1F7F192_UNCRA|nr:MAG: hypothetical protein A2350_20420 [Candidatus Raymondbacteria bacterium RifOxyB12_full_50_8]OGJ90665.1 MAG: hypothetical protein A2268_00645 [Candidatus Raymondbacteria bacterium RifOxyA12_full_50_37]OGJ92008.1 MAG: hypothetical protein A2248_15705 [Candidatus Raymondbacteria bacterium RIFOXYA2_FULL_49_16]OGK00401.1 MAG: hypothetical protein A2519_01200 [Candidatus Raymondbacteria bacterium RIFOXYD12_FULL_49_13]OGP45251.1 MAG: hypothetical protein A2324_15890 [Candidatus Raymondbacteria 
MPEQPASLASHRESEAGRTGGNSPCSRHLATSRTGKSKYLSVFISQANDNASVTYAAKYNVLYSVSDVAAGYASVTQTGSITSDPGLVNTTDPSNQNYMVIPSSSCAEDAATKLYKVALDAFCHSRSDGAPDIGAYEVPFYLKGALTYYNLGKDGQPFSEFGRNNGSTARINYITKPMNVGYEVPDAAQPNDQMLDVYFLHNHLGSPVVTFTDAIDVVSGKPTIVQIRDYYPYGKEIYNEVLVHEAKPGFTGKELDKEGLSTEGWVDDLGVRGLGLDYFGKRYYDPEIGRWIYVDPSPQYFDVYNYTGSNPINRTDPTGSADYGSQAEYEVAANIVMKDINFKAYKGQTYCNYALEAIVDVNNVLNPVYGSANEIITMLNNPEVATPITAAAAVEYAKKGISPVAALTGKDHGHVAAVAPEYGKMPVRDPKTGTISYQNVPKVFNVGKNNDKMGVNFAFPKKAVVEGKVQYFILNDDLKSLNARSK